MTAEEIIKLIPEPEKLDIYGDPKIELLGKIQTIQTIGGEGKGDEYSIVIYIVQFNVYLRADGYYSSYDGVDWADTEWYEVTKQEKTIIVYE